uniref:Uncharacterized protein n=1 Tax=Meloidogyne javanica TaxID=6303 RepID=A0A915N019_MELJA
MISSAQTAIAEAILDTLKALYFFLDRECIEQLPLLLASQLGVFPSEVDRRLAHLLCDCIFPYSFGEGVNGRVSVPAVLILVLHHSADNSLHTLIIERLAYRLPDLYSDLLTVIASGTSESRIAAVNLLFHYWPLLYPGIMLRRAVQYRVQAWSSPQCQNTQFKIVKLLRETSSKLTELSADGESAKRPKWLRQLEGGRELGREIDPLSDERRMLSRFGIWLMVAHCPPVPEATPVK